MAKRFKHINWKRVISAILCVVMLVGALPMSVFAQEFGGNEQTAQQSPQINNLSTVLPNNDNAPQDILSNTLPSDYPQNGTDVLNIRQPQTVGVSTEKPASFANNTANLTYENGYNGTAATKFNSGTGTQADPYIIKTGAQLKYFADQVNAGNTYNGKYIKLDANIDLNGKDWTPIGFSQTHPFSGVFDGNCHEISDFNIVYNSGNAADSVKYYVGFFGYIKNSTIKNFGIYDYKLNQSYNYDIEIGSMVANMEKSTIDNCYAKGTVNATFKDANPLNRSDVITLSTIPENLNYTNARGQGVIIDLRNASSNINKTMTVKGDVSAVKIIGKAGVTYTNFNIVISAHTNFSLYIELENVTMRGNSTNGSIYCDNSRSIYIKSSGTANAISSSINNAINTSKSTLYLIGGAKLTITGASGSDATEAGGSGSEGRTALVADIVVVDMSGALNITGGAGGNGKDGNSGKDGDPSYSGHSDRDALYDGADGGDGKDGGNGGNGGQGGVAYDVSKLIINNGAVTAKGGASGNGGNGGKGGKGGKGQESGGWGRTAGDGGDGGDGGNGGSTYIVGASDGYETIILNGGSISRSNGSAGTVGSAGTAGAAGAKGVHCNKSHCGQWLTSGNDGKDGTKGTDGSAGSEIKTTSASATPTQKKNVATDSTVRNLNKANIWVGGFAGIVDTNSSITKSTNIINNVSDKQGISKAYTYNQATSSNFACSNLGTISNVISSYLQNGTIAKYDVKTWFADHIDTQAQSSATVLNNRTDSVGLVYDTGILTNNTVATTATVVNKTGNLCDVIIPDCVYSGRFIMSVYAIDNGAFWNNTKLQKVTLGANITTIGEAAFMGSSITVFDDNNRNINVGNRAFANCIKLTKADISNAKELGEVSFYACTALSSVTLSDNLKEIKKGVFYNCSKLTSISIPKSVATIGVSSFFGAGLKTVDYSKATALTTIKDSAFATSTSLVDAIIPNSVQTIEPCAYYGCTTITSVSIGSNVKTIGEAAFYNCSSIESVTVPSNVTTIGASVFGGCSKLRSITVPFVGSSKNEDDKTYFGYIFGAGSYKGNDDVIPTTLTEVTVLSGAKKIDEYAFCWCANVKTVRLPETITSIGKYSFCSCGLTEVIIPDSVDTIGYAAFNCCNQISTITVPFVGISDKAEENNHFGYIFGAHSYQSNDEYIPENVSVTISNKATTISDNAFYGCESITSVSIGASVKSIGNYAFYDCTNISSINVPNSVETVGMLAFAKSSTKLGRLTTVVLGNGVVSVGKDLLVGRDETQSITIGSSLITIPELDNAKTPFGIDKAKSNLKEYKVSPDNKKFSSEDGILYELFEVMGKKLKVALIDVPVKSKLPSTTFAPQKTNVDGTISAENDYYIVRIYPFAFAHHSQIKEVLLDYIRDIGAGAFSNCENLETVNFGQYTESDETIVILDVEYPKATEHYSTFVGNSAFANCRKLHKVNLESNTLTKIGLNAFYNCATAEGVEPLSLTLGKNISILSATDDELINNVEYTTAEMMNKSFSNAFSEAKIREFNVVEGNSTFVAVDGVLFYRSGEKTLGSNKEVLWLSVYPRNARASEYSLINKSTNSYTVTYISPEAFAGVENLVSLTIGSDVTQVGREAFTDMTALHTLNVGKDVRILGGDGTIANLFDGCGALQNIYVNAQNTAYSDVDGVLFDKAQYLLIKYPEAKSGNDYVTPNTVQEINKNAFLGNDLLRHITLTNEIVHIGDEAFYKCPNLSFIYFEKGDCPFATANAMKDSNAFYTTNPRVLVCFGDSTNNSKWKSFSTDEANAKYYSEITTQGGTSVKLFQVSEYTTYPTDIVNTGYYAVVVLDKSGALLNDINVSIGTEQSIDTINGIAMFYNLAFNQPYELKVFDNLGEYFPAENLEFYLDEELRITYITLSSVPTVSGVNVSYDVNSADKIKDILTDDAAAMVVGDGHKVVDINSETAKINTWCVNGFTTIINCGMDLDAEVIGFQLIQNGNAIQSVTDPNVLAQMLTYKAGENYGGKKVADLKFTVTTSQLEQEQDLYVIVDFSDGNQVKTKLNIQIFELNFYKIDLSWIKEGLSFEVSDTLRNILSGFGGELSITPPMLDKKTNFSVKVEPDSFKVAFGIGNNWSSGWDENDAGNFGSNMNEKLTNYWKAFDTYRDAIKGGSMPSKTPFEYTSQGQAKVNLVGYAELKYKGLDENGKKDFQFDTGITGTIKFTYAFGSTFTIVVVPVRVECELSAEGKLTYKLVFDREAEEFISDNLSLQLKGEFTLSAGIGCKVASAGVYGSAETVFVLGIVPEFKVNKWTLSGDVGVYVKYDGLFIKWKKTWSILKGLGIDATWVIYKDGKWWYEADGQVASISDVSLANAVYDEDAYEIATSTFDPELMTFSLNGIQEQDNAYSGIDPQMIQIGELIYIVYQDDLNGYSEQYDQYNYQKIVYQTYNINTGDFSEVYVLDDNGYADGSFKIYYNGTDAVVVYTQLNKKLSTDNIDDMASYVGSLEVKTAVLKDGAFVSSNTALTSDECYDMNLRVGEVNGKITAVWVQNAENTMFGTTENNNMSIWYSAFDAGVWSEPVCLKSNINTITDIEIGSKGVVYITDVNNDLTSIGADKTTEGYSDRLITVLDMTGSVVLITSEEAAYHDVSYFADEIVYYVANNLYSIDTNAAYFDAAIAELTEDYTVLTDAEGNVKAILFVNTVVYNEETGADGSNIFAIFCDGDEWGAPIQITDFGEGYYVSSFDAIDFDNEMLVSVLLSEIEYSDESTDEYDNYSTTNRFETLWFEYPTDFVMEDVAFDYEAIVPNADVTFTIKIKNNGYETLSEVPVSIVRNSSSIYSNVITTFYYENGNELTARLLPGESGYIKVTFNVGVANDALLYTVKVGEEVKDVQLWYTDYTVAGKQVLIGDTYHIVALITNNGHISGSYQVSAVCNEEIIWNNNSSAVDLNAGESKYFMIPLETTFDEASRLVVIAVDAENEFEVSNNQASVNVATEDDISEQVRLSNKTITIDRTDTDSQFFDVSFEEQYSLQNVLVNGSDYSGEYTVSGNKVTFDKQSMNSIFADNGIYTLTFVFLGDNGVEKTSTFVVTMTEFFTITWIVDGKTTYEEYEVGAQLVPITPSKDADEYYSYTFDGWDKQLQMTVNGDATYTGTFSKHRIQYEITWVVDGNEETTLVNSLELPIHDEPTKESDAEWDYTFVGWSPVVDEATEDCVFIAEFTKSPRKYTVTWIVNGVETTTEYTYNEMPSINTPQSYSDIEYFYTFKGWDKEVVSVTKNTVYTAQWNAEPVNYTVTWNIDGIKSYSNYTYNQIPEYGSVPTKASTEQYDYVFIGWSPEITAVTENVEYVAQFEAILRKYTVRWIIDGVLEEQELYYGDLPTHPNPVKESDAQYDYLFSGWDREPMVVSGDQDYTAKFTPSLRKYTITWIVDESEYSSSVYYNTIPSFMGLPSREETAQYSYIFAGWTPEVEIVTGNKTYTAVFEQVVNTYTITWKIGDESYTDTYQYGEIPEFDGALFSEFTDESHCYVFTNWDKELVAVTEDATYIASFENRNEHNFTSNVETNEYGIQCTVHTCECGYSYSVIPETTPSISVKSDSTIAGSVAEIEIVIKNNPGVLGAVLTIEFHENLKLLSAEAGEAWSTLNLTLPGIYDNACSFVWDGVSDVDGNDGTILKLRFEISADASVGDEYGVSVSYRAGSIVGENNTSVAFMTYAGAVTIDEYSYGDVNEDGIVDVTDVILIRQYLAGGYGVEINLTTADVNVDGVVDVTDVILIRQYLAGGYGVVLGKQTT